MRSSGVLLYNRALHPHSSQHCVRTVHQLCTSSVRFFAYVAVGRIKASFATSIASVKACWFPPVHCSSHFQSGRFLAFPKITNGFTVQI